MRHPALRTSATLLTSLGLSAALGGAAQGVVVMTQEQVFTNDGSDIGSGLFEPFDPALGTLLEVRLDWSSTYTASFDCAPAGGCETVFGRGLRFFLPDFATTGGLETNSQSTSFGPVLQPQGPVTLEILLEPRSEFRATDFGVDLSGFTGPDRVVDITGTFLISATGIDSISEDITQSFDNRFTLFYDFEPAVIPVPPAAPLLAGAVGLLLGLRRLRRR